MKAAWLICLGTACAAVNLVNTNAAFSDEPAVTESHTSPGTTTGRPGSEAAEKEGLSLEIARDRAKVMMNVYSVTLEVLHHQYFHGDRAVVPARAMQDIFATIKRQSKVEARWISVNMKPMSINHEPKSDFELKAAREIAAGKDHYEAVEGGFYRRAGPIPLRNGCIGCHGGLFNQPSKTPKFAGLVISVPIQTGAPAEPQ